MGCFRYLFFVFCLEILVAISAKDRLLLAHCNLAGTGQLVSCDTPEEGKGERDYRNPKKVQNLP